MPTRCFRVSSWSKRIPFHSCWFHLSSPLFIYHAGNADRHHYETYAKANQHGRLMHIDNGKRLCLSHIILLSAMIHELHG